MSNRYIKRRRKTVVKDNILFFVSAILAEKSLKSLETPGLSAESSQKLTFENGSNIGLPVSAEMTVFVLEKDKTDFSIVNHQKETDVVLLHVPIHRTKHCMQSQLKDVIDDSFREIRIIGENVSENEHEIRHTPLLQSSRAESISSKRIQTHEVRGDTLRGVNSINENTHPSLLKEKQCYMHNHLASKREGVCSTREQRKHL